MALLMNGIAFLEGRTPFEITLIGAVPALAFIVYVIFDDWREARAHKAAAAKGDSSHH